MEEIINNPTFGILISIVMFEIGLYINKKTKLAIMHPLLISIGLIIGVLLIFDIPLDSYEKGGDMISYLLGPATVILAVPLYKQFHLFKQNKKPILIGIIVGVLTTITSVFALCKVFSYEQELLYTLIPKSITTPIGIEVANSIGGIPSITVVAIVLTGITGAIIAPIILKLFRINDKVAIGIAIGTSSHAVGTSKAMEMGEIEGAMSGLSIGLAGIITVLFSSLFVRILELFM
ncbi:membrane protein [Vallitalea longa]|uniref:Membrane protein n=1 Tax=Vallitalea longa TaxID=2936439 RepID=A0A9W5Y816_9FIRM|nr:LrgB family protein [Vallitalea longa]GKX27605.1 membrane protein [Vallitalea longa]